MKRSVSLILSIVMLMSCFSMLTACYVREVIICSSCNAKNSADMNFCSNCGEALYKKNDTYSENGEPPAEDTDEPTADDKTVQENNGVNQDESEDSQPKEFSGPEIYDMVAPSVVAIDCVFEGQIIGQGSGFFYDDKGTLITNYHVIDGCTSLYVTLYNGKSYNVDKVLGYSAEKDIAILSVNCRASTPLSVREEPAKTGETVYAIGNSLGFLSGSFSNGLVSAAEREVDGIVYIQTSAPISGGNSGGPLVDTAGKVIGITSAGYDDGQNLNLAIPIAEVKKISTDDPTTLTELFKQTVTETVEQSVAWISERTVWHQDENGRYVLAFMIWDEYQNLTSCSGTVDIRIVNDKGETVYSKKRTFNESDFGYWYNDDRTVEKYQAAIYINDEDISVGSANKGTVYFSVYGEGYNFEEYSLPITGLPVNPVTVQLPELPITVASHWFNGGERTKVRIDGIRCELVYDDCLYLYFSGEKVYHSTATYNDGSCIFEWKLYDSDGYLVKSGSVYVNGLDVGDKFKDEAAFVWDCIEPGESYRLVITDN